MQIIISIKPTHVNNAYKQNMKNKATISFVLALIIGILIGLGGYWMFTKVSSKIAPSPISQTSQVQVKDLIARVGKLVILPVGEDPVVATINDADSLTKQQVFYKGSINGDVVLVYQKAAKAIVYSPSRNIIVNIGPVVLQNQATTTSVSTATSSSK